MSYNKPTQKLGRVLAILGPTNTGKTHFAVERMLGHRSGIIGLPLRLLAREIYDHIQSKLDPSRIALVTGEEKILPAHASYFICTVEAMPMDRDFAFLAVDEIQMAADPERGHVFTNRLLDARGTEETLFLGAESIRPIIKRLVPKAEFKSRSRFSTLSFSGHKKLSRLPKRSAVVSFSAPEVYANAELLRRHRGGTAVVLGALSPRTRNAQVSMFEAGEVDYLVATDAIGMGLNLSLSHVAFAGLQKFDGNKRRALTPAEIAQIAGRAGRHMKDGTFGTTADAKAPPIQTVKSIENHSFTPIDFVQWRNVNLDDSSLAKLISSLQEAPPHRQRDVLRRTRNADDLLSLKTLAKDTIISKLAHGRAGVKTLWEVCQIPDYRKTLAEAHFNLLKRIYTHLMSSSGILPTDWLAPQVERLKRTDGDMDTLASRLAHIRTWTYISHRPGWLADGIHWQERTREIEDNLSDALHQRLTQRFVDQRAASLTRHLKSDEPFFGYVDRDGSVIVEGHRIGIINGLQFSQDLAETSAETKVLKAVAIPIVDREISRRVRELTEAHETDITLTANLKLIWGDGVIAELAAGKDPLHPTLKLLHQDLDLNLQRSVTVRLKKWLDNHIQSILHPLTDLPIESFRGVSRGILYQLREAMGLLIRHKIEGQLQSLSRHQRAELRKLGVRFGSLAIFLPSVLQEKRSSLTGMLWKLYANCTDDLVSPAPELSVKSKKHVSDEFYSAVGYIKLGDRAFRADVAEQLVNAIYKKSRESLVQENKELQNLAGCSGLQFSRVMRDLGYRKKNKMSNTYSRVYINKIEEKRRRQNLLNKSKRNSSPFAVLGDFSSNT